MHILVFFIFLLIVGVHNTFGQNEQVSVVTDAGHILKDFTVSPDGNYLLTYDNSSVALWNIKSMQVIKVFPVHTLASPRFGPGDPLIIYVRTNLLSKKYEGYHILSGDIMGTKRKEELMPILRKNKNLLFKKGIQDGSIQVFSCKTGRLMHTLTSKPMSTLGKIDITKNDSLVLFTGAYPQIWNIRKARLEHKLPFAEYVLSKDSTLSFRYDQVPVKINEIPDRIWRQWCKGGFTADGNIILGGYNDITTWTKDGKLLKVQEAEGWPILDWIDYKGNRYAATWRGGLQMGSIDAKKLKSAGNAQVMNFISEVISDNFYSSDQEYLYMSNINTPDQLYPTKSIASFVSSDLSPDAKTLLISGEYGNLKELNQDGTLFSYLSNALFRQSRVNAARFLQGGSHVVGGCSNGLIAVWQRGRANHIWSVNAHRGEVMDVMPTNKGKRFISSGFDGWGHIFDWDQQKEIMSMYSPKGTNDYLFLSPDNYYKGTKGVFSDIHFAKGTETFKFDQFDLKYNRPDIILQRLGGDPKEIDLIHKAWLKRVKRMGFTPSQLSAELHAPECNIDNKEEIPLEVSDRMLQLRLSAKDRLYKLNRIMLYLNGVPLLGRHGLDISDRRLSNYSMEYKLELTKGDNEITFSCINEKGVESHRKNLAIYYAPADQHLPDLYIVALGISKYEQKDFNLSYAAKDARDFTLLMSTVLKDKFKNIYTICLTDDEVSVETLSRVSSFMQRSSREDVVMFYYAGHGLLDQQLDYYLSTHKTNFLEPSQNSIPFDMIEDCFDGIKALNRCCFIDACHSGEIDKDDFFAGTQSVIPEGQITFRNASSTQFVSKHNVRQINLLLENLFIDTRWGIGATIISSSGGLEASIEGDKWQNGLFTWCLRKGLSDHSADSDKNGTLTMGELTEYLKSEVYRISGGRQRPVLRSGKSNMSNFILR